jgi:pimeloyl-ACP methyl ester carboxylesterase
MPHITVRGTSTYYEAAGSGEPLLLLHAGFCSIEPMRPQIASLSQRFRTYTVERPGNGRTADRPGPYSYDDMLADTLAHMDELGLESAHLAGFSDGAIIGIRLAVEHPARVRSLVAISANLDPSGLLRPDDADDSEDADVVPASPEDSGNAGGGEDIHGQLRNDYARLSPDGIDHMDVVVDKLLTLWDHEPHIASETLAAIDVPVLILAADRDLVDLDHTVLIARSIPGARLCILPGSHMVVFERPELVNRIVEDFHAATTDGRGERTDSTG